MLKGDERRTVIVLKDVEPQILEHLLNFIYRGETNVPENDVQSLINTAKSLEIMDFCEKTLLKNKRTICEQSQNEPTSKRPNTQNNSIAWSMPELSQVQIKEETIIEPEMVKTEIIEGDQPIHGHEEILIPSLQGSSQTPLPHGHLHSNNLNTSLDSFCSWCNDIFDKRANPIPCFKCNRWFHLKCRCRHNC